MVRKQISQITVLGLLAILLVGQNDAAIAVPTNSVVPTISGTPIVGNTLTLNRGTWANAKTFSYQWIRCSATGTCDHIPSATATTYVLKDVDATNTLKVSVSATDADGSGLTIVSASSNVVQARPVNKTLPTITGSLIVGGALVGTNGTWATPTTAPLTLTYTYRWLRCESTTEASCSYVTTNNPNAYVLTNSDIGKYFRFESTALHATTVGNLTTSVKSSPYGPLTSEPKNLVAPSIGGSPAVGGTLKLDPGQWAAYPQAVFTQQWQKCTSLISTTCVDLPSQTGISINLTQSELNNYYRVTLTAVNSISGSIKYTQIVGPVTLPKAPVITSMPVITGNNVEGQTLYLSNGTWTSAPEPTFTYSWFRCETAENCVLNPTITTNSYLLGYLDGGKLIKGQVKATNSAGSAIGYAVTPLILGTIENRTPPKITGAISIGSSIQTDNGTWSSEQPFTYIYKWQQCLTVTPSTCVDIPGATSATYSIGKADANYFLRSAVALDGKTGFYFSSLTTKVAKPVVVSKVVRGAKCTVIGKKTKVGKVTLTCKLVKKKKIWQ